jgi:hypothetical protein
MMLLVPPDLYGLDPGTSTVVSNSRILTNRNLVNSRSWNPRKMEDELVER